MRYKTPKKGDTRLVKLFAWLPIRISETEKVWLESYFANQTYISGYDRGFWSDDEVFKKEDERVAKLYQLSKIERNK